MDKLIRSFIPDFQKYAPIMDRSFDQLEKDPTLGLIKREAERDSYYHGALDENE